MPNMVLQHWFGMLAPKGLPTAIRSRLHRETTAAASHPQVIERYRTLILEAATSTPEEFRTLMEGDLRRWGKVVKEANIRGQ